MPHSLSARGLSQRHSRSSKRRFPRTMLSPRLASSPERFLDHRPRYQTRSPVIVNLFPTLRNSSLQWTPRPSKLCPTTPWERPRIQYVSISFFSLSIISRSFQRFVSQLLFGLLRGLGHPSDATYVHKRLADEVLLGERNKQPWRRSPMWLVIRITLQTSLGTRDAFKAFMVHTHAQLLEDCLKATPKLDK
jgi:hypothetical protein